MSAWHSTTMVLSAVTATLLAAPPAAWPASHSPPSPACSSTRIAPRWRRGSTPNPCSSPRGLRDARRTGILLLVSLFEHQVIMLPDSGLAKRLGREASQAIIARMTALLASGRIANALVEGLAAWKRPCGRRRREFP